MKQGYVRKLTVTAMLAAISVVLMYLQISVPFMPAFIQFDFSDLPALIGSYAFGPVAGVVIVLLKNVIHLLVSQTAWIGELSNFILGVLFVLPAGLIYKLKKNKTGALVGSAVGSITMAVGGVFSNYFLIYPLFYKFAMPKEVILGMYQAILPSVDGMFEALVIFNLPFTFVKGLIVTGICLLIYKPLSPILKGKK